MIVETIENAIETIRQQSELIDRLYSEDGEAADFAQRRAHTTLAELRKLKAEAESGAIVERQLAA